MQGVELICLNRKGQHDFSILFSISRLLRQRRVKIIQPFLTPASFFGLLPTLMNHRLVKIVTERCGVRLHPHLGSMLYRKAEDFFTRFADWVVANSQAGESYAISRGINPTRIKVIYNGINLERLAPNLATVARLRQNMRVPPGGKVVGITASLTTAKNHATFLQMAKLVSQAMPQTRFAVLGDGPLRSTLEEMAKELGIDSVVTFFGNQREVGSYISLYDIGCLTSVDHEGCSNATLEAMALGKPVVVTDIGGNREIVDHGKTGLVIPPKDPQAFSKAILTCLKQPDWTRQLGERARQKVLTQFSVERMVQDYQVLYESALKEKEKNGRTVAA